MRTPKGVTVWLALWRVARDVDRIAQDDIASLGLCLTDFGVLEVLLHRGPTRVNAIADTVMVSSGSMTTSVDRLEVRGLVRRAVHETDARIRMVELTDEGRALISPAYAAHARTIDGVFEPLSAEERSELLRLLLKLRHTTRTGDR
jgi:MarR family transcriptional regulator, 2-MHQ and catechol-resistance regulon repressor